MPDSLTRLQDADPVTHLRTETDIDAPPPVAVLSRIVATPAPRPRRRRLGHAPRIALVTAAVAAAALAVALLPQTGDDLAARAYAATAPADAVIYTQTTIETVGPGTHRNVSRTRTWQRGDRMRDVMDIEQDGESFRYEHDQRGNVFRTLYNGRVQSIRSDDPGWKNDEGREGFAANLQTVVERFRARYEAMRDAGETTFNGRPARAYTSGRETFYVDRDTALPLGSVSTVTVYSVAVDPKTRRPVRGKPIGEMHTTEIVDNFERLPATPGNLALLDAPAIDAADG